MRVLHGICKGIIYAGILKTMKAYTGRVITPLKFNMGPKNWRLVDVSPFPFGGSIFQET